MKRYSHIVIAVILSIPMLLLSGCDKDKKVEFYTASGNNTLGIEFMAESITNKGMVLVVQKLDDSGGEKAVTGTMYDIEQFKDGKWSAIEEKQSPFWDMIGNLITTERAREFNLKWEYRYGELPKGKYRVVKEISSENRSITEQYYIEFEI